MNGRFEGTLLCTDFDGTLAGHGPSVSPANRDAIRRFQNEGGLFTIASGRTPEFLEAYSNLVKPNAPIICLNGSLIADCDTYETLETRVFDNDGILNVISDLNARVPGAREIHVWHGNTENLIWKSGDIDPMEYFRSADGPYYKVLFFHTAPGALALRDTARTAYPDKYLFERTWPEGFEIMPLASGKGNALTALKARCKTKITRTVGMGDYENDISLIRKADIGIAVGNALEEVKQAADIVTLPNTLDAVAHVIYNLL